MSKIYSGRNRGGLYHVYNKINYVLRASICKYLFQLHSGYWLLHFILPDYLFRCLMTTVNPDKGEKNANQEPLKTLKG